MRELFCIRCDVNKQSLQESKAMYNSWVKCRETCKHRLTINNNYLENCIRIKQMVSCILSYFTVLS